MALKNNQFKQYKNRVQGAVEQDLSRDINFRDADLFKQNIYNSQVQQGLSYNQYQSNIKRKLNDTVNGIVYEAQSGLIGSSALRKEVLLQQDAGLALAGTANSYAQSQQSASNQIAQANMTQQQLRDQYTTQEATKLYNEDVAEGEANDRSRKQKTSAIFGAFGALGTILSFIPPLAPVGFALDAIGAAGMIGTSASELAQNPTGGNAAQFGLDTLFAGLTLIPGVSALKGLGGVAAKEMKAVTTSMDTFTNPRLIDIIQDTTNIGKSAGKGLVLGAEKEVQSALAKGTQKLVRTTEGTGFKVAKTGAPEQIVSKIYGASVDELNNARTIDKTINVAEKAGLGKAETNKIVEEVAEEIGSTAQKVKETNDVGALVKIKNKVHDSLRFKSTFDKMNKAELRRNARAGGDLIGSRKILSYARSAVGSTIRGAVRGVAIGGGRYITSNMLNNYLPGENKELTANQLAWKQTFDELGIPQNLRPRGL